MMKILSLSNVPLDPHLGSGKTRLAWTKGLSERGCNVSILQPEDFIFLPKFNKAKKFRIAIGVFFKVKNILKKESFDLIEFYGDEFWLLLLWLKKIKRNHTLLVAHVDGIELLDMEKEQKYWNIRKGIKWLYFKNIHYRLSKITFNLADKFVCGCNDDLEYVLNNQIFSDQDAICIAPGIDDFFHTLPYNQSKKNTIVFLGSWIGRKGIRIIPKVIENVLISLPDFEFHVYGAWHSKNEILQEFSSLVFDRVKVFSKLPLEDVITGLTMSKIFFFPSYSEGFGLATVEAMRCGIAVVTTKTGLGSDLSNNINALICDFDDIECMQQSILKLAGDNAFRNQIAENGFELSKKFNWHTQTDSLYNNYKKWLLERNN